MTLWKMENCSSSWLNFQNSLCMCRHFKMAVAKGSVVVEELLQLV